MGRNAIRAALPHDEALTSVLAQPNIGLGQTISKQE
jgi:hypothetical protein